MLYHLFSNICLSLDVIGVQDGAGPHVPQEVDDALPHQGHEGK